MADITWILVLFFAVKNIELACGKDDVHVKIATILPSNDSRMFSIAHVRPAIEYAIEYVRNESILPEWIRLDVNYSDSHCNTKDAPVAAFSYYMQKSVDVFLGPVCDYSLAPVARYAPYWKLPVISPGGLAHDFGFNKSHLDPEFPTLTRVGATFNSLAWTTIQTIRHFGWNKIKFIYDGAGHSDVLPRFCYLAGSALIYYMKQSGYKIQHDLYLFVNQQEDKERMLKDKVGNSYGGKTECDANKYISNLVPVSLRIQAPSFYVRFTFTNVIRKNDLMLNSQNDHFGGRLMQS